MATWGSQTWGYENWGTLGDVTITLSGQSTQTSLGSVTPQQVPGWGTQYWGAGEWGDLVSPEVALTGQQLNTNLDQVTISANANVTINTTSPNIELNSIVGNEVAGTSAEVNPLGEELNSTVNSVFAGELVVVEVTSASNEAWGENAWSVGAWGVGDGQTVSIGDTSIALGQQIFPTAQTLNITVEDVLAGISIIDSPIGEELTPDLGSLSFESKYLIGSAQADTDIGTASGLANANVDVTGEEITGSTGQLEYEAIYSFDGSQANITAGDAFGGEVVEIQVTTASAQPWGELDWGEGQWGQSVGTDISQGAEEVAVPSIEVDVLGEQLQTNTGEETVTGTANVTLTGLTLLDIQLGDEDAFTNVRVNVTGQELGPIIIGDFLAGISITVEPTGVTSTVSTGIIGINAWAVVDPGTAPTWTVVDIAA
jgi:hypothetical protein